MLTIKSVPDHPYQRMLFGHALSDTAEDAIYKQDWNVLKSWAMATAMKTGHTKLVEYVEIWVGLYAR